jgi:hypothetical protein
VSEVLTVSSEVETAFSYSVASSIQSLTADSVEIESIVNASSNQVSTSGRFTVLSRSLRTGVNFEGIYYVRFIYSIRFFVESLGYKSSGEAVDDVVVQLKAAVSSGYFAQMLQYYANVFNADSALLTASVTGVSMRYFKVINSNAEDVHVQNTSFPLYGKVILPIGIIILLAFLFYYFWERINGICQTKIPHSRYKSLFGESQAVTKTSEDKLSERRANALEQQLVNLLLNTEDERSSIVQEIGSQDDHTTNADPENIALDMETQNEETIQ